MVSLELEARLDNLLSTAQTETADIDIFAPITEREECPICLIPLPIQDYEAAFSTCCGKHICNGCAYKHALAEKEKAYDDPDKRLGLCAFCRQPYAPKDSIKRLRKLMKKNIPGAFMSMAIHYQSGDGVLQSYTRSLEMYISAAEIGHANAYTNIGTFYEAGLVVEQSVNKAVEFYEIAAKKGYVLNILK